LIHDRQRALEQEQSPRELVHAQVLATTKSYWPRRRTEFCCGQGQKGEKKRKKRKKGRANEEKEYKKKKGRNGRPMGARGDGQPEESARAVEFTVCITHSCMRMRTGAALNSSVNQN